MAITAIKSKTFAQADMGKFSNFLQDGPGEKVSKQFFRDLLGLTGMEISVTAYPPGIATPFFHSHKQNEELYMVLQGEGQMQLDDELIDVSEGSIVRVLHQCSRKIRSGPNSELIFLCIQAKSDSLQQCNKEDGVRLEGAFVEATK
jgi:mannose-6-phosphate isomerase-like protein (cupin superfamily)